MILMFKIELNGPILECTHPSIVRKFTPHPQNSIEGDQPNRNMLILQYCGIMEKNYIIKIQFISDLLQ